MSDPRRAIPGVDELLETPPFHGLLRSAPRARVIESLRDTLDELRRALSNGAQDAVPPPEQLADRTRDLMEARSAPSLRRVINATGIPLHTNLGRAPLAASALEALARTAGGYSNLEYDLERGARGSRHDHCDRLLRELTGAEAALVVNNNAGAVLLALNELAEGGSVIVSRGELVEIGASFRVPEIMARSGARIVEVGATNRTHARDYENAIAGDTRALLKVHKSNFRQSGFVAEVDIGGLAEIAHRHDLPVIHDLGSGWLPEPGAWGLPPEPGITSSLEAGADIVTFSADKLLGGPQGGIIAGRGALIDRMRHNPLLRALRVGKLTLAALEATLGIWRDQDVQRLSALAMITAEPGALKERATRLAGAIRERFDGARITVTESASEVGGGSFPGVELSSWTLRVSSPGAADHELEAACRRGSPPVIGRIVDGGFLLDPRTVLPDEDEEFVDVVCDALRRLSGEGRSG